MVSQAPALGPSDLAVIINTSDPLSIAIGRYYVQRRGIPARNVIEVAFTPGRPVMALGDFQQLKLLIDINTPREVQGYAVTWSAPYRVECMSFTSALAFGFDLGYCAIGCRPTRISPYFNSGSAHPYTELGFRPAMSIAARTFDEAKALIDRGISADRRAPKGTAYLVSTSDRQRNVRSANYAGIELAFRDELRTKVLQQESLRDEKDVLFYFTGRERVEDLQTLHFIPGAMADHLTSFGGALTDSKQMSALRWLEAGATGSYGTVVEPCNFPHKFPHPGVAISRYLAGDTLIEAYWKSVAMPGQGIFIGEPLSAPFARSRRH